MNDNLSHDVVVAGHICLDVIPDLSDVKLNAPGEFYTPGKLVNTRPATLSTGGPVSNTGLAMLKLGNDVTLMGKIGADPFGQLVQTLLCDRWGIAGGMIVDGSAATSYTVVVCPHGFDRMFLHCPGANDTFCADDVNYDLVAKAKLFHLGYPPLMARMYADGAMELVETFRRVHDLGVTTSLDMSLPDPASPSGQVNWASVLEDLLPHVDIALPSAEEVLFMLERERFFEFRSRADGDMLKLFSGDDIDRLGGKLLDLGAKIAAIKCGYRGFSVRTAGADALKQIGQAKPGDLSQWADRQIWRPTFHVDGPPMATGSGDSSIAGFLSSYLRGRSPDECVRNAAATGACNVRVPDALSGIPTWDDLMSEIEGGWQPDPLTVEGGGWKQDGPRWLGPNDKGDS